MTQRSLYLRGSVVLVLLLGAWLRFHALVQDARFHPDEALFATFARNAAVQGDWLLHGPLDKTPLSIYANALAMTAFGVTTLPDGVLTLDVQRGEFAARLPGVFASIVLMAVVYALTRSMYRGKQASSRTSLIVLLLTALSPFLLAFSATAFTDSLMVLCVTLALWMGSRRRWLWAGMWLALGFGCKQQALFYVPLVVGVGWVSGAPVSALRHLRHLLRFVVPLIVGILLVMLWDAARGQETSLWALAMANNEPGRLELASEFVPRLADWLRYMGYAAGYSWQTSILMLLGLGVLGWRLLVERHALTTRIDLILAVFTVAYMVLHALAFNLYDRYLLLILPPVLLLLAGGLAWFTPDGAKPFTICIVCALVLPGLPAALDATERRIPIGGDRGDYDGIDQLGDYLNQKPLGAIIYDHWLGWELGYYMGTWSDKRRVYYPTPEALVTDALLQPDPAPRYLIIPAWATDASAWLTALDKAGFGVSVDHEVAQFTVIELIPPSR